jgi:signal transduction histidine kinase
VIDDASHAALNALRAMLDVLQGTTADEPAPGLAELDALVGAHRATHGPVTLEVDPDVAKESASLRLTIHRIVQEALTNVGRHAPGASATVRVHRIGGGVEVAVDDDGRRLVTSGAGTGSGFGLAAMRERIELFGGELDAGPSGDGGFRVHARLPLEARC